MLNRPVEKVALYGTYVLESFKRSGVTMRSDLLALARAMQAVRSQ